MAQHMYGVVEREGDKWIGEVVDGIGYVDDEDILLAARLLVGGTQDLNRKLVEEAWTDVEEVGWDKGSPACSRESSSSAFEMVVGEESEVDWANSHVVEDGSELSIHQMVGKHCRGDVRRLWSKVRRGTRAVVHRKDKHGGLNNVHIPFRVRVRARAPSLFLPSLFLFLSLCPALSPFPFPFPFLLSLVRAHDRGTNWV